MPREARRVSVIPERQEYTRSYEQENQRKKRIAACLPCKYGIGTTADQL